MQTLLGEIGREIAERPAAFIADILQSALLVGILVWVGRRYFGRRLAERRSRIAAELADAEAAQRDSERVAQESLTVVAQAKEAATQMLHAAREQAAAAHESSVGEIAAEAQQIVEQARSTVELEKAGIRREAADRLARLTSETARRYVDEILTESERRALTQKAIVAFLEEAEAADATTDAAAT